jgi:fluoroacetyl-CoA thioesterase
MDLSTGLVGRAVLVVTEKDTAGALGSGDVPVLGTPRIVALAEAATMDAVRPNLPDGTTTVGTRGELDHSAPSRPGSEVVAEAVLVEVDGRQLWFDVTVREAETVVASGRVRRMSVDRARFLARLGGAR